jgi:hypothetical protein
VTLDHQAVVFSPDRVSRLRMVVWIVAAIGALVALLALLTLTSGDDRAAGVAPAVVAVVLLGSSGTALRLLREAERPAKLAAIATGALCVVSGVLSGSWLAFLLLLVGLVLVFLALLPDEPEATR